MRRYAPFYCEENVWQFLAEASELAERQGVLVINESQTIAMWGQRAADPTEAVVWDYHVVAMGRRGSAWVVVDLDARAGAELPVREWAISSFRPDRVADQFLPRFRVIPGDAFVVGFASDRSHMRFDDGGWRAPPPPWPAIGSGPSTLAGWRDVRRETPGELLTLDQFLDRFGAAE